MSQGNDSPRIEHLIEYNDPEQVIGDLNDELGYVYAPETNGSNFNIDLYFNIEPSKETVSYLETESLETNDNAGMNRNVPFDSPSNESVSDSNYLFPQENFFTEPIHPEIIEFAHKLETKSETFVQEYSNNKKAITSNISINISGILLFSNTLLDPNNSLSFNANYPPIISPSTDSSSGSSNYITSINPEALVSTLESCSEVYDELDQLLGKVGDLREIVHSQILEEKGIKTLPDSIDKRKHKINTVKLKELVSFTNENLSNLITLWYGLFLTGPPNTINNGRVFDYQQVFDPWKHMSNISYLLQAMEGGHSSTSNFAAFSTNQAKDIFKRMREVFGVKIESSIDSFSKVGDDTKDRFTLVKECFNTLLFIDNYFKKICAIEKKVSVNNISYRESEEYQSNTDALNAIFNQILVNQPGFINDYNPHSIVSLTIQHDILSKICIILGSFRALVATCHQLCYTSLFKTLLTMGSMTLLKFISSYGTRDKNSLPLFLQPKIKWIINNRTKTEPDGFTDIDWVEVFSLLPDKKNKKKRGKETTITEETTKDDNLYKPFVSLMQCDTPTQLETFITDTTSKSLETKKLFFTDRLNVYGTSSKEQHDPNSFLFDSIYSKYIFRKILSLVRGLSSDNKSLGIKEEMKELFIELKNITKIEAEEFDNGTQTKSKIYFKKFGSYVMYASKDERRGWLNAVLKTFIIINHRKSTGRFQPNYFPLWIFYAQNQEKKLNELVVGSNIIVHVPEYFIDAELMGGDPTTLSCSLDRVVISTQQLRVFRTWHSNNLYDFFATVKNNDNNGNSSNVEQQEQVLDNLSEKVISIFLEGFPLAPSRYNSMLTLAGLPNLIDFDKRYFHTFVPLVIKLMRIIRGSKNMIEKIKMTNAYIPSLNVVSIHSLMIDNVTPQYNTFEAFESILCIEENAPRRVHLGRCWLSDSFFNKSKKTLYTEQYTFGFGFKGDRVVLHRVLTPRLRGIKKGLEWSPYEISINSNTNVTKSLPVYTTHKSLSETDYLYGIGREYYTNGKVDLWKSPVDLLENLITKVIRGSLLIMDDKKKFLTKSTLLVNKTERFPEKEKETTLPPFTKKEIENTIYNVVSLGTISYLLYEREEKDEDGDDDVDDDYLTLTKIKTQTKANPSHGFNQAYGKAKLDLFSVFSEGGYLSKLSFNKCMDNREKYLKKKYYDQQGGGNRGTMRKRIDNLKNVKKEYIPYDPVKLVLELIKVNTEESKEEADIVLLYPKSLDIKYNSTNSTNNSSSSSNLNRIDTNRKNLLFGLDTIQHGCNIIFETNLQLTALFPFSTDEESEDIVTEDIDRVLAVINALHIYALGHRNRYLQFVEPEYATLYKDLLNDVKELALQYFKRTIQRGLFYRSLHNCLLIFRTISKAQLSLSLSGIPKKLFTPAPANDVGNIFTLKTKLINSIYSKFNTMLLKTLKQNYQFDPVSLSSNNNAFSYNVMKYTKGRPGWFLSLRSGFIPVSEYIKLIKKVVPKTDMYMDLIKEVKDNTDLPTAVDFMVEKMVSSGKLTIEELIDNFNYMAVRCEELTIESITRCLHIAQYYCNFGLQYNNEAFSFVVDIDKLKDKDILTAGKKMIGIIFNFFKIEAIPTVDEITKMGLSSDAEVFNVSSLKAKSKTIITKAFENSPSSSLKNCTRSLQLLFTCALTNFKVTKQAVTLHNNLTTLVLKSLPKERNSAALPPLFKVKIDQLENLFKSIEVELSEAEETDEDVSNEEDLDENEMF